MLKNGIYEQIVNTRINKELQQLDREKYDIELEKLDGEDARRILTIYISYVINQALQYLRDSFRHLKKMNRYWHKFAYVMKSFRK